MHWDSSHDELRPQIPQKPLLGPHRFDRVLSNIERAIVRSYPHQNCLDDHVDAHGKGVLAGSMYCIV